MAQQIKIKPQDRPILTVDPARSSGPQWLRVLAGLGLTFGLALLAWLLTKKVYSVTLPFHIPGKVLEFPIWGAILGIAANLVRRRQAEAVRLNRREPLASDLLEGQPEILDEDELFERLARGAQAISGGAVSDPRASQEDRDGLAAALALLPPADREMLRLCASGDLDGDFMAAALHVTPGAARVRLHRALTRLRRVWKLTQEETNHD